MLELEIIKPKMLEMELLGQAPSNSIIQTQEKEVTPTTNVQEITPDKDYDGLSKVTVNAVTNEIDENISSENILQGVSILGVEGILKPEKEEEVKTIEIKTNRLTSIKPTEGKTMGEVLVTTAVSPTKGDLDITENGNYDVSDYVGANVNVQPVLQDKSITITENGTTNITADEGYNGLNNVSVTTNVASSGEKNNIFIQEEEPEQKEGIWIKTNKDVTEKEIKNLEFKTNWSTSETPTPYMASYQRVIKVGDYLYVFGGRGSAGTTIQNFYRYNLKTHTTEDLTDIPDTYTRGRGVGCVGTDIYMFGGMSNQGDVKFTTNSYKYDTLTDTFTTIKSLPKAYSDMLFTTVGTDIYLIGGTTDGNNSGTMTTVYKYDTLTDTYTEMTACPKAIRVGVAVTIGTDIYLFNGYSTSGFVTNVYKYNTLTNAYTTRATLPKKYGHNMGGLIGNDVYLIGGFDGSGRNYIYKYDVTNNSFTQMENAPHVIYNAGYWSDGETLYIVGGQITGGLLDDIVTYSLTDIDEHLENTLIISTNNKTHKSKINETTSVTYENVYLYNVNDSSTKIIESYNGDGTQWIKN